jgi:hypothetical protein
MYEALASFEHYHSTLPRISRSTAMEIAPWL